MNCGYEAEDAQSESVQPRSEMSDDSLIASSMGLLLMLSTVGFVATLSLAIDIALRFRDGRSFMGAAPLLSLTGTTLFLVGLVLFGLWLRNVWSHSKPAYWLASALFQLAVFMILIAWYTTG